MTAASADGPDPWADGVSAAGGGADRAGGGADRAGGGARDAGDGEVGGGDGGADGGENYRLNVDGFLRTVNGARIGDSLLTVLRDTLGVTAVKDACEQGRCGACSVLLDGRLAASCTVLAADADGTRVVTVAGLGGVGLARAIRAMFLAEGAVQCGFCTPGFVVAVTDLLTRHPDADEQEIREALAGNICRCTGYGRILAAVRAVQAERGVLRSGDADAPEGIHRRLDGGADGG
ncbi:(2Fe-2S)-binding protein [Frankia sp. AvcI1]|uniref:(2Fe-2S)-binding protein n=1 Tax=Frankia sp. AvcI1 TaxID=573496 RepID=UPI0007C640D2